MEFKGTKGEWVNGWNGGLTGPTTPNSPNPTVDNDRKYTPVSIGMETIAIVIQQENDSIEELDANSKLIAAAPNLLEALRDILEQIDYPQASSTDRYGQMIRKPSTDKLKEALKKAL